MNFKNVATLDAFETTFVKSLIFFATADTTGRIVPDPGISVGSPCGALNSPTRLTMADSCFVKRALGSS